MIISTLYIQTNMRLTTLQIYAPKWANYFVLRLEFDEDGSRLEFDEDGRLYTRLYDKHDD